MTAASLVGLPVLAHSGPVDERDFIVAGQGAAPLEIKLCARARPFHGIPIFRVFQRRLRLLGGVDADVLFEVLLRKAVEGKRRDGTLQARSGYTPRTLGAAVAGELFEELIVAMEADGKKLPQQLSPENNR